MHARKQVQKESYITAAAVSATIFPSSLSPAPSDSPYPHDYVWMGRNVPTEAVSHRIRFGYGSLHEAFVIHDWVVQMEIRLFSVILVLTVRIYGSMAPMILHS